MRPFPAHKVPVVKTVEGAAHAAQPLAGIDQHGLGRIKPLARLQRPAEIVGIDAHHHAGGIVVVHVHDGAEIAAVHQIEPVCLAVLLVAAAPDQRDKRILRVRGGTAAAVYALHAVRKGTAFEIALLHVSAVQRDEIVVAGIHIHAEAHHALDLKGFCRGVGNDQGTCHRGKLFKHRVHQRDLRARGPVAGQDLQRLAVGGLFREQRGQTGDPGLAGIDFMRNVAHVRGGVAVRVTDLQRGRAHIRAAVAAHLEGPGIGRKAGPVIAVRLRGGRAEGGVPAAFFKIGQIDVRNFRAVIQMQQKTVLIHADHVR